MITDSYKYPISLLFRDVIRHVSVATVYVLIISWLDVRYELQDYNLPASIVAILGTVIGLLLGFRTNSGYARWWEARTLWGAIVNDSRTWVRQLIAFSGKQDESTDSEAIVGRMAYRQIAWCYALSRHLRGDNPTQDLAGLLDHAEIASFRSSQNVPNAILLRQANDLRELSDTYRLELFQFVELEKTLRRLTDSMGGCERIKNTPFPISYSRMVDALIYLFVFFLPFGLVDVPTPGLILTSLALSIAFLMIEHVAIFLQDPFSNRPSDTPVLSLSRTIEINIKEMLGEQDLPEKPLPVEGVLY